MYGIDKEKEAEIRKCFLGKLTTREIDFVIKELQVFHLLNETDRKLSDEEIKFIDDFLEEEKRRRGRK